MCLLSSLARESRHPVSFFFFVMSPCWMFFVCLLFFSFQPQAESRSADIPKTLMPLDKHGDTLAGRGRTTEVFGLSPCRSGGASSGREGVRGRVRQKKKINRETLLSLLRPPRQCPQGCRGDEETQGTRGPRGCRPDEKQQRRRYGWEMG